MLQLAFKNIKKSFGAYRNIYVLFLVSQLVSVIVLLFSYGTVTSYELKKEEQTAKGCYVYARFIEPVSVISVRDVIPELVEPMNERVAHTFVEIDSSYEELEITCIMEYYNGRYSVPSEAFPQSRLYDGRYIDEMEMNDGSRVAFGYLDYESFKDGTVFSVGDKYTLFGEEYEIVGIIDGGPPARLTIPINSVTEDMKTSLLYVEFNRLTTKSDYDSFTEVVNENFSGNVRISDFGIVNFDNIIEYDSIIMLAVIIGVISTLNTILIYNYIMKKRKKQMAIYRIEGAGRMQQIAICEIEVVLVTVITSIVGVLIFNSGMDELIIDAYNISMPVYSAKIYLIMLGIYAGCIILGSGILVTVNTRGSILGMRR